jgi:hypothetical protein
MFFIAVRLSMLCALFSIIARAAQQEGGAAVHKITMNKLFSETEPGNLLPQFMFQQGAIEGGSIGVNIGGGRGVAIPFTPDDTCGDDIFEGANLDLRSPQLPYLTQDLWGCERESKDFPAWTLEDDYLEVTVTPQWAGKVWSIYDKKRGKDILFNNRAHQPANIGALKAWAAGGAEWNWSPGIIGHSAFSETQVYLAELTTERGPVLRVYDYDRYNGTVWQVDMLVSNGTFFAHPRILNPTDVDLRGYWWTCVAVDNTPSTRIFTPATHLGESSRGGGAAGLRNAPWPWYSEALENSTFAGYEPSGKFQSDMSYIGNHQLGDQFLRIPDTVYTPYIGHTETLDKTGYTLIHGHPLNGTKFFTWGDSGPGRFMQDFLAGGDKRQGDYTELQVGPAPTQMQTFPMPKQSELQWTEWFKGFNGDNEILKSPDYSEAMSHVDNWIQSDEGMPKSSLNDMDAFFESIANMEPTKVLVDGSAWAAVEEKRLGRTITPAMRFNLPEKSSQAGLEVQPWLDLLDIGTFSDNVLSKLPLSYQTTDAWLEILEKSTSSNGMNWLNSLHLAVNYAERGEIDRPLELFQKSADLQENVIAYRCIAVMQSDTNKALAYFLKAWETLFKGPFAQDPSVDRIARNMVTEISFFLQQRKMYSELAAFLITVPEKHHDLDAFITSSSHVFIATDRFDEALNLLGKHCFPTYAGARDDLMDMWNNAIMGKAAQIKGSALSTKEAHQARVKNPVPENIGCKYASEYCTSYW